MYAMLVHLHLPSFYMTEEVMRATRWQSDHRRHYADRHVYLGVLMCKGHLLPQQIKEQYTIKQT